MRRRRICRRAARPFKGLGREQKLALGLLLVGRSLAALGGPSRRTRVMRSLEWRGLVGPDGRLTDLALRSEWSWTR